MFFFQKQRFFKKLHHKKPTVYTLPALHFDPAAKSTQAESVEAGIQLLRQYVQACRIDPFMGFSVSGMDLLKPYLDMYPEDKPFLKQLVAQERCSVAGSCQQICQTKAGGEALIRNIVLGRMLHQSWLEDQTPVLFAWDAMSHVPQMPQILERCGYKAAVFDRMQGGSADTRIPGVEPLFYWIAPNGSGIYVHRVNPCLLDSMDTAIEKQRMPKAEPFQKLNAGLLFDAKPMQPPNTLLIGKCKEWSQQNESVFVTGKAAEKFFSAVDTTAVSMKHGINEVTRDFSPGSDGVDLARMDLNIACRRIETVLFETEFLQVLCGIHGWQDETTVVHDAWQQLLYCQQNTAVGGWCSDIAYLDLMALSHETLINLVSHFNKTVETLSSSIHTAQLPGDPIFVMNALPWRRDGICSIFLDTPNDIDLYQITSSDGGVVPIELEEVLVNEDGSAKRVKISWVEPDMNAAGYQSFSLQTQGEPQSPYIQIKQSQRWLENEFIRLEIDPDRGGGIVSLVDKTTGYEFINPKQEYPANDVICMKESGDETNPQRLFTTGKRSAKSDHPAFVDYYQSPVSQSLLIKGHGPGPCRSLQEIKLYHELPYIDCKTILDNYQGYGTPNDKHAKKHNRDFYALGFPLNLPGALPVLEDRFYAKAMHRSHGNFDFRGTQGTNVSKHGMNSFNRWVDVSWSFLVRIIKNKTEVGGIAVGPAEVVTAHEQHQDLRSKMMLHLARHGVTCTPRADIQDCGDDRLYRQCSFSIGSAENNVYTRELLENNPDAQDYYDRSMEEFGYAVMIVPDMWLDQIFPVFLFAGQNDSLIAQAVDELIHSTIAHRWDCPASSCFMPDLPIVQDAGFAFLHSTNSICSVEQNGALVVGLMHTAPYIHPKTKWGLEMAEQKTHVFQYRLYPHEGDWRHAEIPRRGIEYQHQPLCTLATKQKGVLPLSQSLFSIEPSNVMVSAIKPPGFESKSGSALFGNGPSAVVRVYEAHGEESNLWIESVSLSKKVDKTSPDETVVKGEKELYWEEGSIRTFIHANEISTFRLHFKPQSAVIHTESSKNLPTKRVSFARYWKYNAGSISNSSTPLRLMLRGQMADDFGSKTCVIHPIQALLSNYSQSTAEGTVILETPPYWRVVPNQTKFQIPPEGFFSFPALVIADQPESNGVIRAKTEYHGVEIMDEITVGQPPSFDVEMTLTAEAFFIHLSHHFPYTIHGTVQLILPVESWQPELMKELSLSEMNPAQSRFTIAPGKKVSMDFSIQGFENRFQIASDHHWLVVKITSQYCNWYYHVRLDGRPSGGLGCVVYTG